MGRRFLIAKNHQSGNGVVRIYPSYKDIVFQGLTEDQVIERVITKHLSIGTINEADGYHVIDEADLPGGEVNAANDLLFDAWVLIDGVVTVDMDLAQDLGLV
jgi:hypothetical protein